ncbi:nucleotide exchange factor GrpE [Methylococcus sp. EFPC2]|uniref:nucleotide exchange factor GrpE n=1 Tax=Methylococcus sp. EFPC2 TaxID=2812648 RepID=UPI0019678CA4|nr:nucleotide exchange factor GrpE [Methylococcus sp. EFPC2]QSA97697.1 nucleotide exchange factor GrpE [Methylococcus sp. EFPC2]
MSEEQIVQEEPAAEPEQIPAATETVGVEQLIAQLEAATQKAEENWDKLVRAQAEMENLRRRTEKELQSAHKYALEKFAKELLAVVDSLELGIQAAAGDAPEVAKLREGNELTLKQLQSALERFNVLPVDPAGQKFNPEHHQAMAVEPTVGAEPGTVVKVFQKGYLLNDRLLRPAMVVIAQPPAEDVHLDEQA